MTAPPQQTRPEVAPDKLWVFALGGLLLWFCVSVAITAFTFIGCDFSTARASTHGQICHSTSFQLVMAASFLIPLIAMAHRLMRSTRQHSWRSTLLPLGWLLLPLLLSLGLLQFDSNCTEAQHRSATGNGCRTD